MNKENQYIDYLFAVLEHRYTYSDIIIRLDLIGILGCYEKIPLEILTGQIWEDFFPAIKYDNEIGDISNNYYEECRLGFKITSRNEKVRNLSFYLRMTISAAIIGMIDKEINNYRRISVIRKEVLSLLSTKENNISHVKNQIRKLTEQYYADGNITNDTIGLVLKYRHCVSSVLDKFLDEYPSEKKEELPYKYSKISQVTVENSIGVLNSYKSAPALLYASVFCLLYNSLLEKRENVERNELIKEQWPQIFKTIPYTKNNQAEVDQYINNDANLKAMDTLFKYPLIEIRSGRYVRRIAVSISLHKVLSSVPANTSYDVIVDEAMSLYAKFASLSLGKEEEDIEELLKQYLSPKKVIDEHVSRLLWENEKTISAYYNYSLICINSADSARKRNWWEELLEKKNKDFDDLHTQIGSTRTSAIYELVDKISGPSYNYVLSRLYRYAYSYDKFNEKEMVADLKKLIQVLNLFGVTPICAELINKNATDVECTDAKLIKSYVSGMKSGTVVFPGWSVAGDTVIHPIMCQGEED